jgi:hypothetical protein
MIDMRERPAAVLSTCQDRHSLEHRLSEVISFS